MEQEGMSFKGLASEDESFKTEQLLFKSQCLLEIKFHQVHTILERPTSMYA